MTLEKAIKTLRWQLTKSDLAVGPGLKEATKEGIKALEEKRDHQKGGLK